MRKIFFGLFFCLFLPALILPVLVLAEPDHAEQTCAEPVHAGQNDGCRHKLPGWAKRWLRNLPEDQQARARAILQDALPEITRLRHALRSKVEALADLNYDEVTPPETLLQLGRELQEIRNAINEHLARLDKDLHNSVGSAPGHLRKLGRHKTDQN